MTKLQLVVVSDEPFGFLPNSPEYRGFDRYWPDYYDTLPITHPLNQAFLWGTDETGDRISNLEKALQIVERYKIADSTHTWEILEIVNENECPQVGDEFIGFEPVISGRSLINGGWDRLRHNRTFDYSYVTEVEPDKTIQPLLHLLADYFQPTLNWAGLFSEYNQARYCLSCMMALQKVRPHQWESDTGRFGIFGVWKVTELQ